MGGYHTMIFDYRIYIQSWCKSYQSCSPYFSLSLSLSFSLYLSLIPFPSISFLLCCADKQIIIPHHNKLHNTTLTTLHCTALYSRTSLHCTVLYCTMLHRSLQIRRCGYSRWLIETFCGWEITYGFYIRHSKAESVSFNQCWYGEAISHFIYSWYTHLDSGSAQSLRGN